MGMYRYLTIATGATLLLACSGACGACARISDARPSGPDRAGVAEPATVFAADAASLDAPDSGASMAPIAPEPLFTNLSVPGFPEVVVSVPTGATSPRPVVVALHGTVDRADWNCDAWRHVTGARGFVVCPLGDYVAQGSTRDDARYSLLGGEHLRRYVDAALEALAARFAGYVDLDRPIVTGFSLGATQASQIALADPVRFPRVALLEGGHGVWTLASSGTFASRGGLRVLFGCGSRGFLPAAKAAAARLEKSGVEARVVFADVGHTIDRPLQEAVMAALGWFVEGDPRWGPAH